MSDAFLEMSYRHGKAFAAYLHLPHVAGAKVTSTREVRPGLVVDFAADGAPMGLEIVNPTDVRVELVLTVLVEVHAAPVAPEELAPLRAA